MANNQRKHLTSYKYGMNTVLQIIYIFFGETLQTLEVT